MQCHKLTCTFLLLIIQNSVQAFSGLDVLDGCVYYAEQQTLYAQHPGAAYHLNNDLNLDSGFLRALQQVSAAAGIDIQSKQSFSIHNITCAWSTVFVCVQFISLQQNQKKRNFALFAFDRNLKLVNYYSIPLYKGITSLHIPPYQPLEFKDSNHIIIPYFNGEICAGEFFISHKNHKLVLKEEAGSSVRIVLPKESIAFRYHVTENYLMNPMIRIVPGSSKSYYSIHPFPVVYSTGDFKQFADPLNKHAIVLETHQPGKPGTTQNYLQSLRFETEQSRYGTIMLSSIQRNDTVYSVISDTLNNRVLLHSYAIRSGNNEVKPIETKAPGFFFLIRKDRIFQLVKTAEGNRVYTYSYTHP